jgi:hypothetical protein
LAPTKQRKLLQTRKILLNQNQIQTYLKQLMQIENKLFSTRRLIALEQAN